MRRLLVLIVVATVGLVVWKSQAQAAPAPGSSQARMTAVAVSDTPPCCPDLLHFPALWLTNTLHGTVTSGGVLGQVGNTIGGLPGANLIAITPSGAKAYVTRAYTGGDNHVVMPLDLATGRVGKPIPIPGTAPAIAIGPGGKTVYVTTPNGDLTRD